MMVPCTPVLTSPASHALSPLHLVPSRISMTPLLSQQHAMTSASVRPVYAYGASPQAFTPRIQENVLQIAIVPSLITDDTIESLMSSTTETGAYEPPPPRQNVPGRQLFRNGTVPRQGVTPSPAYQVPRTPVGCVEQSQNDASTSVDLAANISHRPEEANESTAQPLDLFDEDNNSEFTGAAPELSLFE